METWGRLHWLRFALNELSMSSFGTNMKLRIAACQILTFPSPDESASKVIEWMERAAADGVQAIAFPEACLCGYQCSPDYWDNADPKQFADAEKKVAEAARRLALDVVLGTVHWEADGSLLNSLVVISKEGKEIGRYAKTHLAENWPQPGRVLPIYEVGGVPSCFIICHDERYPELVRLPAALGARVCYYLSNESGLLSEKKLSAYRAMPIARATENTIFVVMANAPANPDDLHAPGQSHGNSKIIHPDGNVLVEAGHFEETLVTATIEIDEATGAIAKRAINDDTILANWMKAGLKLVSRPS
jgi:predicted amidohydrolase